LTSKNSYYKYLLKSKDSIINNLYLIPNLDFNDRFIYNENDFNDNSFNKLQKLNDKYKTDYQILIHSKKTNNLHDISVFLIYKNNKYFLINQKKENLNYEKFFKEIYLKIHDKWKDINKIDTKLISSLNCTIYYSNIYELKFVSEVFKLNRIIQSFHLKSISLNKNTYNINYFGNLKIFKNSLEKDRLNLLLDNNKCEITLK